MSANGIRLIASEYHILWEALKHYEERLEKLSSTSADEDQQLKYDEKLQDIDGLLEVIKIAAENDYELMLV
ncbi:hypothetical protein [Dyella mobilis]|uniref:Uncharacterized protein n=1 Tax=Dyella mobilis TaxID=1849582 RepID=A0ABS2KCG8_9GAMM|nr:hypothetical protein [Dyella mobilis]MBM7128063.1 hypothetical protein [Dyella mobilis]GLR00044.1 hypothetical protein GCM10007863_44630 [Dyella mobilis]